MITQEFLKERYNYDAAGFFVRKITLGNRWKKGTLVKGSIGNSGRRSIQIKGKSLLYSRLIFLFHYGYLPRVIDHKNRNYLDNRIENLREANHSLNGANKKYNKKIKGVRPKNKGFEARICRNGISYYLGVFKDEITAAKAYDKKAKELFGEYACTNF